MKNRDFKRYGLKFHLNDRQPKNEFTAKYTLLYFNEFFGYWVEVCGVDSKKEALQIIEDCHAAHCKMFAY